jgi:hypothetical protein
MFVQPEGSIMGGRASGKTTPETGRGHQTGSVERNDRETDEPAPGVGLIRHLQMVGEVKMDENLDRKFLMSTAELENAVRFTLEDHQRLLRECDVEHICPSKEICFEYSDRVRCGPCAFKQALAFGVATDDTLPFSPEQYRLRRRMVAAQAEGNSFCNALEALISGHLTSEKAGALSSSVAAVVSRYRLHLKSLVLDDPKRE